MSKKHGIIFKPYNQDQPTLLPPTLDELIPSNHLVRVINSTIDKLRLENLLSGYKGGGTSSYHPKMLLKVIIYAYTQKIYTSRMIAKSLRENINFMWLSGNNRPDFRTINRYRNSKLKETIEEVFSSVISFLYEEGIIKLNNYFLDGTKVEANANKYSFVWKKNTERYKKGLKEKIKLHLKEIETLNEAEELKYGSKDLEELNEDAQIDIEKLEEIVKELDERLEKEPSNKNLKRTKNKLSKEFIPNAKKYNEQERILKNRNSFSKTDTDATFMRMKEDHMGNGQLKAGYNIQAGTEEQFILGYSVHQKPGDTTLLIPHIEKLESKLPKMPESIIADSGYGSEENYTYLENKNLEGYVKYNNFHFEQTKNFKSNIFRTENLQYDKEKDEYICPNNKRLEYIYTKPYRTENGYQTERKYYKSENCKGCPLKEQCHKGKTERIIQVSEKLEKLKKKAKDLLNSEKGQILRSKRPVEIESVFGQIKQNMNFRRFLLRGLENVNLEFGLIALAHNFKKLLAFAI